MLLYIIFNGKVSLKDTYCFFKRSNILSVLIGRPQKRTALCLDVIRFP